MNTSTKDLHIFESGDGGELVVLNGDLVLSETLFQTIYLALFGGNVAASTIGNEIQSEERFDYWGNSLVFPNSPSRQFNSETERTLLEVTTNSIGRLKIKSAVENDLNFLKNIANISVEVVILSLDKIQIGIQLSSIANQSNKQFQFIWDNAKNEVIIDKTI